MQGTVVDSPRHSAHRPLPGKQRSAQSMISCGCISHAGVFAACHRVPGRRLEGLCVYKTHARFGGYLHVIDLPAVYLSNPSHTS